MQETLAKIKALYLTHWNDDSRQQAFEWLWESYYRPLTCFLSPMTKQDTADVVQDVMLKIYEALPLLNPFRSLSTWIFTIARNQALNHLDKKNRRPQNIEYKEELYPSGSETDSLHKIINTEGMKKLHHLLETLPAEHQQMTFLFFYQGLKYREIARVMGKPVGSVKSRIYLVRKMLTKELEEYVNES